MKEFTIDKLIHFSSATSFWWDLFKKFMRKHFGVNDWRIAFKDGVFRGYLSDYLHHKLVH